MKIMGFGQTEEDRAEQQRQSLKDPEVQAILQDPVIMNLLKKA